MSDFLAAFPSISMNEYLWELSMPLITIMSCDKSRIEYDYEDDKKDNNNTPKTPPNAVVVNSTKDLAAMMGFNI